jgi:hypothetical protein
MADGGRPAWQYGRRRDKHVVLGLIFPKYISSELRVKDAEKLVGRIM